MITACTMITDPFTYDYPVYEACYNALQFANQLLIVDGSPTKDECSRLINDLRGPYLNANIKIIRNLWDPDNPNMEVEQRNLMLQECDGDWISPFDADEIFHEKDFDFLRKFPENTKNKTILIMSYKHFYRDYFTLGPGPWWSPKREFMIKKSQDFKYGPVGGIHMPGICPHTLLLKDGKTKAENQNNTINALDRYVYHYGWTRNPKAFAKKQNIIHRTYRSLWGTANAPPDFNVDLFQYNPRENNKRLDHHHPRIMSDRIQLRHKEIGLI